MATYLKDPNAVLPFRTDWTEWLANEDGDTIATSTWVDVTPGITIDSDASTTTTATVWLSGGTVDVEYRLTNRIVTAGGRTNDDTLVILVQER